MTIGSRSVTNGYAPCVDIGRRRSRSAVVAALVAVLLLAACTDDDDDPGPTTTTPGSTTTSSSVPTGVTTTTSTAVPLAPPQVTGLTATSGGGSGETLITWPPLPIEAHVASYKLYKRQADGTELAPATVTDATLGIAPGRLGIVDAPDTGPWATPTLEPDPGPRCYKVSAVSDAGVEGPQSAEACGSPVGG